MNDANGIQKQENNNSETRDTQINSPEKNTNKSRKGRKNLTIVILSMLVLTILVAGYFLYQDWQITMRKARQNMELASGTPTPDITAIPTIDISPKTPTNFPNSFTYNNFTVSYPDDWHLLDASTDENFPISRRLTPLYPADSSKVIALQKDDVNLILTIQEVDGSSAGGIFFDNKEYNEYVSNRDVVHIGNSTFYLSRNIHSASALVDSHGGPYTWSALSEYFPNKETRPGTFFKGYNDVITRNGYLYNFILVSENGGQTDSEIQNEMVSILESIEL